MSSDPHLIGLITLPGMGPARLRTLLAGQDPRAAWEELLSGSARQRLAARTGAGETIVAGWIAAARRADPGELASRYEAGGIAATSHGGPGYPQALHDDPEPPAVLFSRGDLARLDAHRRVAIVGTRSCTRYGIEVARELGESLAVAGASVVSGLAVGIDSAAHAGALAVGGAPPVAVVGSGLDVVYPRANAGLWQRVAGEGLLLSEAPMGAQPERWRFPARNRIIAGISEVVVVVESHESGGSLSTADEALERGVQVLAVPGSIHSPASVGTNRLIADGSMPVCRTADVLELLGLPSARHQGVDREVAQGANPIGTGVQPPAEYMDILEAFGSQACSFDLLSERTGRQAGQLALALEALESSGWVELRGLFYERVARPRAAPGPQGQPR